MRDPLTKRRRKTKRPASIQLFLYALLECKRSEAATLPATHAQETKKVFIFWKSRCITNQAPRRAPRHPRHRDKTNLQVDIRVKTLRTYAHLRRQPLEHLEAQLVNLSRLDRSPYRASRFMRMCAVVEPAPS